MLLSNFSDGYKDLIFDAENKKKLKFSYIPSRTELGEVYFNRVKNAYKDMNIEEFNYVDIDKNYNSEDDFKILNSDIVFLAGGDDPFIIKNLIKRGYDALLRRYYDNGGTIIGLCAGASVLSKYTIVSDYEGEKFTDINVIPWGIGINDYLYYSRFDDNCNILSLEEFSGRYNIKIIAASLDSAVMISDGIIKSKGELEIIDKDRVIYL